MSRFTPLLALLLTPVAAAQWTDSGTDLWTYDRVGIRTTSPEATFHTVGFNHPTPAILSEHSGTGGIGLRSNASGMNTIAIWGQSSATSGGFSGGVYGLTASNNGFGVRGRASSVSGVTYGVKGEASSPQGYSGFFSGGKFYASVDFFGINRINRLTGNEVFGIHAPTNSWGGMYIDTDANGRPFYGYAVDGDPEAWTSWDSNSNQWQLWASGKRLAVDRATGNVGIGVSTPQYRLHIAGDAAKPGGGSWTATSDRRLKKDIEPIDGALDRLLALRGVTFEFKDPAAVGERPGQQIGVIAQEVEEAFPDWVDEGPDGYKRVTFRGFEALTVEALRDLRADNDDLRAANEELRAANDELRASIEELRDLLGARRER